MKNIILIMLVILITSCSEASLVSNTSIADEFKIDSTNLKFYYDSQEVKEFNDGDVIGKLIYLDFNNKGKYYNKIGNKSSKVGYNYVLMNEYSLEQTLVDSLNFLFLYYNYNNYPYKIPFGLDSTTVYSNEYNTEIVKWRFLKSDKLYEVNIGKKAIYGSFKYPDKYEEFSIIMESFANYLYYKK